MLPLPPDLTVVLCIAALPAGFSPHLCVLSDHLDVQGSGQGWTRLTVVWYVLCLLYLDVHLEGIHAVRVRSHLEVQGPGVRVDTPHSVNALIVCFLDLP